MHLIASLTSDDIVEASLHELLPRTNQDLITTAGNQSVRTALMHLNLSTATVPMTDGNKMRLQHVGSAMNRMFGPLTTFHTQLCRQLQSRHPYVAWLGASCPRLHPEHNYA